MGSQQQFCLRWNNHQLNMLNVFDQLLQNESFVDVTLACDGLSLKAHKVVLSACSPYFQKLLLDNPCQHPIVILKDVNYADLKALVDFMYKGEVNVLQDQLQELLKTADLLKIKGLCEVSPTSSTMDPSINLKQITTPATTNILANNNNKENSSSDQSFSQISLSHTQVTPVSPCNTRPALSASPPSKRKRARPQRKSGSISDTDENVSLLEMEGPPEAIESKVDVPQVSINMDEPSQSARSSMDNEMQIPKEEDDTETSTEQCPPEPKVHEGFTQENDDMHTPSLDPPTLLGISGFSSSPSHHFNLTLPPGLPSQLSAPSTSCTKFGGPYPCHICSRLMRTRKTLKKHMMIHNPFREHFPCTLCPRVYQRKDKLNSHFRLKHALTPEVTITFKKPVDDEASVCSQKHLLFGSHSA